MPAVNTESGLTHKQEQWIGAYLQSFNATDAARKAGYGGTDRDLAVIGFDNLRKPNIVAAMAATLKRIAAKSEKQQVSAYEENLDSVELLRELKTSCVEWLRVNGTIDLDWRANECKVIYHDPREKTALNWPKQRKAKLQEIIDQIEQTGRIKVEVIQGPTVDLRKYILEVLDRIDACIDKFAKFAGDYAKERENPQTVDQAKALVERLMNEKGWAEDKAREAARELYSDAVM